MQCHESAVKLFVDWLKCNHAEIIHLDQISHDIAMEYFDSLWDARVSAVTCNKYRQSLHLVFKTISDAAGQLENPFSGIIHRSEQPVSRKEFTEEEVDAIFQGFTKGFFYQSEQDGLGAGRKRIRKVVTKEYVPMHKDEMFVLRNLCCWTGCRGQDGCLMKWENVDWTNRQISYVPEKAARIRMEPFHRFDSGLFFPFKASIPASTGRCFRIQSASESCTRRRAFRSVSVNTGSSR